MITVLDDSSQFSTSKPIRRIPLRIVLIYPTVIGIAFVSGHPVLPYLPALLIYLSLLWLFGRTLKPGCQPLVSRLAELARGQLEPRVARYTRRVTQAWTGCFALLSLETLVLAFNAPVDGGILLVSVLNALFIIGFFLVEYGFRRYWLADLPHPGFRQYIRFLRHTDWRVFWSR
ncbi:MAG: hypothetical protein HC808_16495 [Candidatus Competibacteraceae bacterium]|nr:hypothetical protein [Candidatus Competibacteraceae bacterium]